ncbi:hypothetical protein G7Y89_g14062 [Cudoniella acicularis]|uniref:non-specific serine/threonine protein kinase n=1 Tax=Cudoniella acicularis TaxID=354080 RepID=A0A8H4R714_9HELO|nr:hypothetical protein G7Y89_g14062 [Cudoniella acicularis]
MGPSGGFDLPPSTMAAQLIHNIATTNEPSREPQQDDLKKLMTEVSELENNPEALANAQVKLGHKHKLIYVFARAVLERLTTDDPFMNVSQLVSQAADALDIFVAAIKETPAVLCHVMRPEESLQTRGREPLWMWLFPRILVLLGRRDCDALTEKTKDFFCVCFQVVSRSPKLWNLSSLFFSYLKESTLGHLQSPAIIQHGKMSAVVLPFESLDSSAFSYDRETASGSVPLCTYTISDAVHAFWHINNLLAILIDISMAAAITFDATPAFQDYLAWVMDSLFAAHELQRRWRANPQLLQYIKGSTINIICAVQALVSSLRKYISDSLLRKGYLILSIVCAEFLEDLDEVSELSDSHIICSSLLQLAVISKEHDSVLRSVSLHLVPAITATLGNENALAKLGTDFQKAARSLCQACGIEFSKVPTLTSADSFESVELEAEFRDLGLGNSAVDDQMVQNGPASKRRKIQEAPCDIFSEVVESLYLLLGAQSASDLAGLSQVAGSCFMALSDNDRCKAIDYLARIPCAAHGSINVTRDQKGTIQDSVCFLCDGTPHLASSDLDPERCLNISSEAIATFAVLIKSSAFLDARRPRVLAMFALRRFTVHFHDPSFIDLEKSILGQWCLQSLSSSVRELRVAAGVNVLAVLRSFAETGSTHYQETCILAWGQIGRISNNEELNIVLLGLVRYLGHSNPVVSGVAFNEIINLSKARRITVERMLSSFWDTIAIEAVKDLLVRPQTTQLMADLLGISVSAFLVLTQTFTLPWLVLLGKTDVIKRVSEARKDEEIWNTLMDHSNLVTISPLLLMQNVPDTEAFVMRILKAISPRFKEVEFKELLKIEPAQQAFNLLKAAVEAEDSKKARIRLALQFLAANSPAPSDGGRKKNNAVGLFLQFHILGLVKHVSEVVNDPRNEQPMKEKERCIKALEELVKVAKMHVRTARTQICACLQSALAQKELQGAAFSAWGTMLANLADDDVEVILETTFSMIIQHWNDFNGATKSRAKEILDDLVRNRAGRIRSTIFNIPSLSQFPELAEVESQLKKWRTPTEPSNAFQIFSRRIGHENSAVVNLALVELKAYLETQQSFLQASAVSEQPDSVIAILLRSILDTCVKFNGSHSDIANLSAECIGLIGCLDSNRVESVRDQNEMVVVSNFDHPGETTDFVLFLLEELIVPAFLSASDTGWQGFLSYVMQELLSSCDFSYVCGLVLAGGGDPSNPVYLKWLKIPETIRDTLTPFLSSKYALLSREVPKFTYPIFCPENMVSEKVYNVWLRKFALDLLQKPLNNNALLIYPILFRAINMRDLSIASFLLPYLVLHVLVLGTEENRQDIGNELLRILRYEPEPDSKVRREELKLCIEAVFRILDYCSRWVQEKQTHSSRARGQDAVDAAEAIRKVEDAITMIPPEIISQRAVECKSYSRALFYWEQHICRVREVGCPPNKDTELLEHLQDIYTQIDEPDGIEGISAHLHVLDVEQQILGHQKAGRWTAAQSWYEIKLAEHPDDVDVQVNLLTCLKESGQHDVLLNYVEGMQTAQDAASRLLPFATEASWATGRWSALEKYTNMAPKGMGEDFNVRVGQALLALHQKNVDLFKSSIKSTREQIACSLSVAATASFGACHDSMLKLHVLTELEMIAGTDKAGPVDRPSVLASLNRRLEVIGAYLNDKQYLLGLRRAAMQLSRFAPHFPDLICLLT